MTQENSYYSFEISAPRSPLKHFEAKERNVYCSFVDETFFENGLTQPPPDVIPSVASKPSLVEAN